MEPGRRRLFKQPDYLRHLSPDKIPQREQLRSEIHQGIYELVVAGEINNVDDVVERLNDAGLDITRRTKRTISVRPPNTKQSIWLQGAVFEEQFRSLERIAEPLDRPRRDAKDNLRTFHELRKTLEQHIAARAERNQKRYGARKQNSTVLQPGQREKEAEERIVSEPQMGSADLYLSWDAVRQCLEEPSNGNDIRDANREPEGRDGSASDSEGDDDNHVRHREHPVQDSVWEDVGASREQGFLEQDEGRAGVVDTTSEEIGHGQNSRSDNTYSGAIARAERQVDLRYGFAPETAGRLYRQIDELCQRVRGANRKYADFTQQLDEASGASARRFEELHQFFGRCIDRAKQIRARALRAVQRVGEFRSNNRRRAREINRFMNSRISYEIPKEQK